MRDKLGVSKYFLTFREGNCFCEQMTVTLLHPRRKNLQNMARVTDIVVRSN